MKARYKSLRWLVHWREEGRPIDWIERFGRRAPLEVEIGFGNGEFLTQRALDRPDQDFVGVELHWESAKKVLRRLTLADASNVRIVLGHARVVLERLFSPRSVERMYSLFPCPWPKEHHTKHRLFSSDFLRLLNSRIVDNGEIQIVTDHRPYLDWVLEQVPGSGLAGHFEIIPPRFDTKYERKWETGGQDRFFDLRMLKKEHVDLPLKEDVDLRTHRVEHFDPDRFQPSGTRGDITIDFKEFLYDPKRHKGMTKVYVGEEDVHQTVWIEIVRTGTDWLIRPARGCGALPTVGFQKALDLVREAATPEGLRKE